MNAFSTFWGTSAALLALQAYVTFAVRLGAWLNARAARRTLALTEEIEEWRRREQARADELERAARVLDACDAARVAIGKYFDAHHDALNLIERELARWPTHGRDLPR